MEVMTGSTAREALQSVDVPFPFPGVSVVSPKKMLVDSPEEIAMFPIDQEKNLEGREEGRDADKLREDQRLAG